MTKTAMKPMMRALIIALAVVAGILVCAIFVAATSPGRFRAEATLAEAKSQVEDARKDAADRIETLERENADLRKQLELAKANLDRRAEKLAAAEQEGLLLQGDLDTALTWAELNQRYADAQIKKAEDSAAEASEAERKARLDVNAVKKDTALTVVKAQAADNRRHGHKNGKNNNVATNRNRGPVASLPRTCPSFSELDTNHDGRLSLEEYKVGFPDAVDVEKDFKALDTNGDGALSIDEYKAGHPDPPVVRTTRPKKN